jgi:pimeloyl-ACP methyl ester carboxylesterase
MSHTIVLVHGAFAESSSWERVIGPLTAEGHHVVAAANPLRGLVADARSVSDLIRTIEGPVVLVGHSYGGAVITNVDASAGNIVGLVYVSAFAPDAGENCFGLAAKLPGSMVDDATVRPVSRSDGATDLYIAPDVFHDVFCADLPAPQAALMAATQRPVTQQALVERSGDHPLWKDVPSWFLIGEADRIIPAALQHLEADRARARAKIVRPGASHAVALSQPRAVAELILKPCRLPAAASSVRPDGDDARSAHTTNGRHRSRGAMVATR